MPDKYLVIFDTVALVQATINELSAAGRCLTLFEQGKISVAVSRATLAEAQDVLSRPYLRQRYDHITEEVVANLIQVLSRKGHLEKKVRKRFSYPRDPKDEPFLNLAIEVKADYLISRDNDLLDLMDWNKPDGREFQRRFRFLKIVKPEEFLQVMKKSDTD